MAQEIKQGNIFGRIGSGIGKGLADQIPKEVDRYRLKQGLEEVGNRRDQTPFQQFSGLASVPGVTPQMIQSGSELLRQQAKGQALNQYQEQQNLPKKSPFPSKSNPAPSDRAPSITKGEHLEASQEGYIPPTQDEIFEEAGKRYNSNPALYNNDPNKAIEAAENDAIRSEKRNEAHQRQHQNLTNIQDNVVKRLDDQSKRLGVEIPNDIYTKIEDKAIQATKPLKNGGQGLTEQQSIRKFGDELDEVSRDYSKINEVGNWGITGRSPKETLRSLSALQESFDKRDDTRNLADKLISDNKLSPKVAYSIAEPVRKIQDAQNFIKTLPNLEPVETLFESKVPLDISIPKTLEIAPKLAKLLSENSKLSPLAVAYEIEKKGYDSQAFLEYVTDHRKDLNLKENQWRQVETPQNLVGTWNDWWLSSWSGL